MHLKTLENLMRKNQGIRINLDIYIRETLGIWGKIRESDGGVLTPY